MSGAAFGDRGLVVHSNVLHPNAKQLLPTTIALARVVLQSAEIGATNDLLFVQKHIIRPSARLLIDTCIKTKTKIENQNNNH